MTLFVAPNETSTPQSVIRRTIPTDRHQVHGMTMSWNFPPPYEHDHLDVVNVREEAHQDLTFGERAADWVAALVGSWRFIVVQSILLAIWVILNVVGWIRAWDPYPFILLNLFLSLQAAYTAPMLMMSQNRQAQLDRLQADHDYKINIKAEEEIRLVLKHLEAQNEALLEMMTEIKRVQDEHRTTR